METHSEHMVLRLQQHVASGRLPRDQIVIHYVYADNRQKRVVQLNLDDKGVFDEEWPEGFFPERLEEAKKLARARHKAR